MKSIQKLRDYKVILDNKLFYTNKKKILSKKEKKRCETYHPNMHYKGKIILEIISNYLSLILYQKPVIIQLQITTSSLTL
jgi:HD superfamily phosphodiesterase